MLNGCILLDNNLLLLDLILFAEIFFFGFARFLEIIFKLRKLIAFDLPLYSKNPILIRNAIVALCKSAEFYNVNIQDFHS